MVVYKDDWSCWKCGLNGTEEEIENHKCKGWSLVVDGEKKTHLVR